MKILYVTAAMMPWEVHGLSVHTAQMAKAMAGLAEVTVLYMAPVMETGPKLERRNILGIDTVMVPNLRAQRGVQYAKDSMNTWLSASYSATQCWGELREFFEEQQFDIIHFQDYYSACLLPLAMESSKAKIISTIHAISAKPGHFSLAVQQWLLSCSHLVIAVSQWERKKILQTFRVEPEKVSVIYNGCSFSPLANEKRDTVTFLGRLEAKKGCDIFVQALEKIGAQFFSEKGLRVQIAGEGSQKEQLQKIVREAGLEDICDFTGAVPHAEVEQFFDHSLVHVVPSREESFGLTAIEAMSRGARVVASDIDGLQEAVEGSQMAELFPEEDTQALAQGLKRACECPPTEEERQENQNQLREKFSWETAAAKTYQLYQKGN